jgi:hypothetical protein
MPGLLMPLTPTAVAIHIRLDGRTFPGKPL